MKRNATSEYVATRRPRPPPAPALRPVPTRPPYNFAHTGTRLANLSRRMGRNNVEPPRHQAGRRGNAGTRNGKGILLAPHFVSKVPNMFRVLGNGKLSHAGAPPPRAPRPALGRSCDTDGAALGVH
ncbi:hypothetical protein EVAR_52302_1 [Eumeta japonica]|uniref:Uncharacterized protein n=1 Tax=Eumeta variegata TaxID=151549 RepID=A0A4C1Y4J2_EUMVA|nr:hypothetical protein EVAR_52302_1 [Eumeta japonica]